MVVEAHHLRLFQPQQQIVRKRDILDAMQNHQQSAALQMFYVDPTNTAATAIGCDGGSFFPISDQGVCLPAAAVTTTGSESGITLKDVLSPLAVAAAPARKRQRVMSILGEDVSSQIQQQQAEIECVVRQHTERLRSELAERRKRFSIQLLAAVEEGNLLRLRAKAEEVERIDRLNYGLQERIRSLAVENQFWRDLAQSHEEAANVLRKNLEQVLAAQQVDGAAAVEDAESCCGGNDDRKNEGAAEMLKRACRACGMREPTVLILPCRHLCVCVACSPETDSCPVCKSCKYGSVLVNMS